MARHFVVATQVSISENFINVPSSFTNFFFLKRRFFHQLVTGLQSGCYRFASKHIESSKNISNIVPLTKYYPSIVMAYLHSKKKINKVISNHQSHNSLHHNFPKF